MASISSPGIGSGLDVSSMVEQLIAAERAPAENRLNRREASYQAELSAYGTLKSTLSGFQSALASLTDFSNFQSLKAKSSDNSVVGVSASDSAISGNYSLEVTDLAKAQTVASKAFTATTSQVGTGTLTFQFGTYDSGGNTFTANADRATQTVDISTTDNSLIGIRDAVNNADIGVSASIVNDGSGYRLVFNSEESGAANSLKVTVADSSDGSDLDDAGLSQLAYDPTGTAGNGKNMTETVTAQDASFSVNGLAITSSSNEVSGVIDGVTLSLKDVTSGTPVSISVSQDTASVTKNVESFVTAYNDLMKTINSMTSYNAETGRAGILLGDSVTRGITSQVRTMLSSAVTGLDGAYRSLADIGITTEAGGTLTLDKSKLSEALEADAAEVARLFSAAGSADDPLISYLDSTGDSQVGDYAVNITQLATRGSYAGASTSGFPLTVDAGNDTFTIKVDGTQSATISLTQQDYASGDELAAELQNRINGDSELSDAGISVSVSFVTDHFEITSSRYGSESTVELVSVDTNTAATLGLSAGAGTDGVDVAGTIGGVAATGSGQVLSGSGDAEGIRLEVTGGVTGDRGSLSFTRGIADQLNTLLEGYLGTNSLIDARTEGLNSRIDDITDQRERLSRRLAQLEARYMSQFTALDALISQMTSTSNYLAQQLAALPGASGQ